MEHKHHVLIDATQESHAPFFARNDNFNSWLHSYDNVFEALKFINGIELPYSTEVYIARDTIYDPISSELNAPTLIKTLGDLQSINHISVYSPNNDIGLEQQIRSILPDKRQLKKVISVINLRTLMCEEGRAYLTEKICHCIANEEINLIPNYQQDINRLTDYYNEIFAHQRLRIDALVEEHFNRPSEEVT
ncbi:unnamed protein product [Adineta steineri]|uniref:Uncharacterized protein n=1 Tax=Adineta steineri TaxID=433720 RepID=A0A814X8C7_9BILA|nr:unnamed protein product [Adineta steineri]